MYVHLRNVLDCLDKWTKLIVSYINVQEEFSHNVKEEWTNKITLATGVTFTLYMLIMSLQTYPLIKATMTYVYMHKWKGVCVYMSHGIVYINSVMFRYFDVHVNKRTGR